MESRTLDNLILENEDFFFTGDLTIIGDVNVSNSNIIVVGNLTIRSNDVNITNGCIIVSDTLEFEAGIAAISIIGCDISCENLITNNTLTIRDGDIYVACFLDTFTIDSDSNIEVLGNANVTTIMCLNYLVYGNNESGDITTIQDVYISGSNWSTDIKARDIFIGGSSSSADIIAMQHVFIGEKCDFNDSMLICKRFDCNGDIKNCSSMSIG